MVILARINHQLSDSLGGLKKRLKKKWDNVVISQVLREDLVLFMDVSSQEEAIQKLTDQLESKGAVPDKNAFLEAVMAREKLISTGIGMGIAVPHAKISGSDRFFIAVGIQTGAGLEWDSLDGSPVRIIFMIGGPENKQVEYLKILSCLTIAIKGETLRKKLFQATTGKEVLDLFEGY